MAEKTPIEAFIALYMTVEQVAEAKGVRPATVRLWARDGVLPFVGRFGGVILFEKAVVAAFTPPAEEWREIINRARRELRSRMGKPQ